jgi:putative adenylate-forming enzyme
MKFDGAGLYYAARAFVRTRWLANRLKTRIDVERYRTQRIARMMRDVVPQFARYQNYARFDQLPVIDKAALLADFAAFNRPGISVDRVRAAIADGASHIDGHGFGQSTGTSGNRGYYVISDAERFTWLGTILAKALPDALWARHRVALALPGLSSLYQSASSGSRVQLAFFDLAKGIDAWSGALAAFAPDTIVAPPKVLRALAEHGLLRAQHIFSGAEVLDPLDRQLIEHATARKVREIYMATEGLFGVACPYGTLHLAEDAVAFEWERPVSESNLMTPIVTDFTRATQLMARYRMNDLLELSDAPCRCGSPLQAVARIEGRQDDIFLLPARTSGVRMVTPDVLRNAVIDSDPRIDDFRIVQTGIAAIEVGLPDGIAFEPTKQALTILLQNMEIAAVTITRCAINTPFDRKLRRVRREWHPD